MCDENHRRIISQSGSLLSYHCIHLLLTICALSATYYARGQRWTLFSLQNNLVITISIIPLYNLKLRVIDQMAQSKPDSVRRMDFHSLKSFSNLHIQVSPPGRWRECEGRLGSADSGVEPGNPIFNVPTPGLLRVTAYLLMSRKAPSYPSPYIDSTLTAVSSGSPVCCQSITHF